MGFVSKTIGNSIRELDYQEPLFMTQYVSRYLRMHRKGVFMLRANTGMGKTVFCSVLDDLGMNKRIGLGMDIRITTVHIEENYLFEGEAFAQLIGEKISGLIKNHHQWSPPTPQKKGAYWLADLLNSAKKEMPSHQKLMLIIDGLDKIPYEFCIKDNLRHSVYDYIPWDELLIENVFVLLVQNVPREISNDKNELMITYEGYRRLFERRLQAPDRIADFYQYHESYREQLVNYLDKKRLPKVLQSNLIEYSKAKFEAVAFMELLIRRFGVSIEELGITKDYEGLLQLFFSKVEKKYDDKYKKLLLRIMITIATAFRPLTIDELIVLIGKEWENTPWIIAGLNDIRCLLHVEQIRGVMVVSIENDRFKQAILAIGYEFLSKIIREEWLGLSLAKEELKEGKVSYLFEYILQYVIRFDQTGIGEGAYNREIADVYVELLEGYERSNGKINCANCYLGVFKFLYALHKKNQLSNYKYLTKLSHRTIWEMKEQKRTKEAIWIADNTVEILEALKTKEVHFNDYELASAYKNLGVALYRNNQYKEAVTEYQRAISLREALKKQGKSGNDSALASCYMNMAIAFGRNQQVAESLNAYQRVIELRESMVSHKSASNENDLAGAYMNMAITLDTLNHTTEAIKHYKRAIFIREKLRLNDTLQDENGLALAYCNLGMAFHTIGKLKECILEYKKSIGLMEFLQRRSRLTDENALPMVYANLAAALKNHGHIEQAIEVNRKAISLMESLKKQHKLTNDNDLVTTYMNLGLAYRKNNKIDEAINTYHKVIKLSEELDETGKLDDIHDLATAYVNRAISYIHKNHFKPAVIDSNRAVNLFSQMIGTNPNRMNISLAVQSMYLTASYAYGLECLELYQDDIKRCYSLIFKTFDLSQITNKSRYMLTEIDKIINNA